VKSEHIGSTEIEKAAEFEGTSEKSGKGGKSQALKGFKHSKPGLLLSLGASAFSGIKLTQEIRKARSEGDRLKLVNAAVGAAALVTGALLVARELRNLNNDDVLAD
jgi:hypothetical protein